MAPHFTARLCWKGTSSCLQQKRCFPGGAHITRIGGWVFLSPAECTSSPYRSHVCIKALLPFIEIVLPGCSPFEKEFPRAREPHHKLMSWHLPVSGPCINQYSHSFPKSFTLNRSYWANFKFPLHGGNWKFMALELLNGCGRSTFFSSRQQHLDSNSTKIVSIFSGDGVHWNIEKLIQVLCSSSCWATFQLKDWDHSGMDHRKFAFFFHHYPSSVLCDLEQVNQEQTVQNVRCLCLWIQREPSISYLEGCGLEVCASVSLCAFLTSRTDWTSICQ